MVALLSRGGIDRLLGDYLQLVAEVVQVTLDRLDASCLLARLKACDGIATAEDAVLRYSVLAQSLLLADTSCHLLYFFCCHNLLVYWC